MPVSFTLRLQFAPHRSPTQIGDQLEALVANAPVDEVMFFFFGEEQNNGHETLREIQEWIDRSRPYRNRLRQLGIAVSLNPWHTLLHSDSGRVLKPNQTWQTMVDPQGIAAKAVVCPLDPNWQTYYLDTLRLYAKEDFRVVWIDDDIRYHNHAPLDWGGCFCDRHIEAFGQRIGKPITRSKVVQACLSAGDPHPWRAIWLDLWQEQQLAFLSKCRSVLEQGGVKMGLMSSLVEAHSAEGRRWTEWWSVFSPTSTLEHRPHFWGYNSATSAQLPQAMAQLDQIISLQPKNTNTAPEIENFPYGRWNKSYRETFAQMSLAVVFGAKTLNISLYDFMGNDPANSPSNATFLRNAKPALDQLSDHLSTGFESMGIGLPWSENTGRKVQTQPNAKWDDLQPAPRGWANWLGAAGVAFSAKDQPVNALAGSSVWGISDENIQKLLARSLLIDGEAAEILFRCGYGQEIGLIHAERRAQQQTLYSMESLLPWDPKTGATPPYAESDPVLITVNNKPHTQSLLFGQLERECVVRSEVLDPKFHTLGFGSYTFTNRLGGKVAVVAWNALAHGSPMMNDPRAEQLRNLSTWLWGGHAPLVFGAPWLVPQFFHNGSEWRAIVWNASPDVALEFSVSRPAGKPPFSKGIHFKPDGSTREIDLPKDTISLPEPLFQWEFILLL